MVKHTECRFCRFVNHTLVWRPSYKKVFNSTSLAAMTRAIAASEAQHTAQIGVIAEHTLPYSYLWNKLSVRARALTLFGKHRFWDTERNVGILIYCNWVERAVEIIADRHVARLISQTQWDAWVLKLQTGYAHNDHTAVTCAVLADMGDVLSMVLPRHAELTNSDSLSDRPVIL